MHTAAVFLTPDVLGILSTGFTPDLLDPFPWLLIEVYVGDDVQYGLTALFVDDTKDAHAENFDEAITMTDVGANFLQARASRIRWAWGGDDECPRVKQNLLQWTFTSTMKTL